MSRLSTKQRRARRRRNALGRAREQVKLVLAVLRLATGIVWGATR